MPHAPLFACGMTYPGAAAGIGIRGEARSAEHAGRVAPSRPVDIADHVGRGAGSALLSRTPRDHVRCTGIATSEWRSHEQAEGIGSSMTVDITDTGAAGAQAAGPGLLPRADQAACVQAAVHAGYAPSRRRRRGIADRPRGGSRVGRSEDRRRPGRRRGSCGGRLYYGQGVSGSNVQRQRRRSHTPNRPPNSTARTWHFARPEIGDRAPLSHR